ncbi:M20 family metallopeptidase [Candidatus Chloroploca sp. M-50]|uniref:M20 family metallopeptidase n=1 Tax=Candidatus Chloroploca mongolica TaxID=2528176 RepID=A0ABS4D9D3_9CHLR|nr:M20 family metallopeptidase [Candidatus Chloroploca mongolica]MBP1466020.1 M20 family metallopeptidase [Candidatus Chloroploca mongolica]
MSILPSDVLEAALKRRDELLTLAETLVAYDTPSGDKVRCDALADELAARYATLGTVERINNPQGGDHLRIRVAAPGVTSEVKPALILCHYDTVWSAGTVAQRPMYVEGDRAFGPGLYDMKISLAMAELALHLIKEHAWQLARPVILLLTSDEEIGSPTSRDLIETTARECNHVLVLEPPVEPDGELKTARKGIGMFNVTITGRAAHAGVEPEKGTSAISELAYQILAIHALADHAAGTTTNVGIVQGGTRRNVVPAEARMEVDARVWTSAEARRLEQAFQNLRPVTPGVQVEATGSFSRPPMERTPASRQLFAEARHLGAALELNLGEGATGGGSDGNFTAALGIATLDGLGAPGAGAHAEHEQISISGALERMALLIMLLTHM